MTRSTRFVMLGLLVTVSLLAASAPAQAVAVQKAAPPADRCVDGATGTNCDYCSHNGSAYQSDWEDCENGESGYYWTHCTFWSGSRCQATIYAAFDAYYVGALA